ncbi:MAG TPA: hypothetical protein VJ835_06635 [Fimbriimonadaceae bacterium]|nr:hypothetical protein [Fimbriimonadaceae bacterium]
MRLKLICAVALVAAAISTFAQGENPALRRQMENIFAKMDQYVMTDNMPAMWAMFHPGYYSVDTEGKRMTLAQFKAMVNGYRRSSKMVNCKTRIWNVQLQDQEAVVWVQQEMTWKEPAGNGRWAVKKSTTRWAENLVHGGPLGWQFKSSQQLMTNEPWTFKTTGGG